MKKYLLLFFPIVLISTILLLKFTNLSRLLPTKQISIISPDILSLTQPVNRIYGVVEEIGGNFITVANNEKGTTSGEKILSYKVLISSKTQIFRGLPPPPPTALNIQPVNLTIKDFKKGQNVNISSTQDLRTLPKREFEASLISIIYNTLSGTITKADNDILEVKGQDQKDYSVTIQSNTQTYNSRLALTIDTPILISFDPTEASGTNIKAFSIQLSNPTNVSQISTSSATPAALPNP